MTLSPSRLAAVHGAFGPFTITVCHVADACFTGRQLLTCFATGVLVNSNISGYMTGSSLIAMGLTWWQAIIAIAIGDILATILVVLNSLPGAYYHRQCQWLPVTVQENLIFSLTVGFPVVNRYVWGLNGSAFVIWNRILLSIGKEWQDEFF